MAKLGDLVKMPEENWKRFYSTDENIEYINLTESSGWYESCGNGTCYMVKGVDKNNCIRFNFTGSKIRLYGVGYPGLSGENDIYIDGKLYHQNYNYTNNVSCLSFSKEDLQDAEHYVEIRSGNCTRIYLDAIDIGINNIIKKFNKGFININYKFLIQDQDNNLYIAKNDMYKKIEEPKNDTDLKKIYDYFCGKDINEIFNDQDYNSIFLNLKNEENNIWESEPLDANKILNEINYIDLNNNESDLISYKCEKYNIYEGLNKFKLRIQVIE